MQRGCKRVESLNANSWSILGEGVEEGGESNINVHS